MEDKSFNGWGIVELMGHKRIAGRLSERTIAGSNLLQVDIPLSDNQHAGAVADRVVRSHQSRQVA